METAADRITTLVAEHRTMVVGVGNRLRGDDAVGSLVAERLHARFSERAIDAGAVPENHLGQILRAAPEVVLFVDAADHGGSPGSWVLVPAAELAASCASTHTASLQLLAQILSAQGIESWLVGVQPGGLEFGAEPGHEIVATTRELTRLLAHALKQVVAHAR